MTWTVTYNSLYFASKLKLSHSAHFIVSLTLIFLLIAPAFSIASSIPASSSMENGAVSGGLNYCREHFNSGDEFHLGTVLESKGIASTSKWDANGYEVLKRGDKIVAFASQGAMVCVQGLQAANPIWVPKKSIAITKRDVVASKSTWAGIWRNSGGSWFVVSPNFDNSVTIVDGQAFNAGTQRYGMLRGLVGSTKDDLSGMARSLLFKESLILSDKLSPRQIETLRDSACRFDGFLLDDVIVIYNQQGSCGGMSINFDGIYRRAEKYPIPGVVNTEQRKFSRTGRPQV